MIKKPVFEIPANVPLLDVRSPREFAKGHIPGAVSFPLFSDQERHEVGTVYKQKGRDESVLLGLKFVGPKLSDFVQAAAQLSPEKKLTLYCWRGGMRSGSMAWLLKTAGFEVTTIKGGYKAWRKHVLDTISFPYRWICIGGLTGSGKTDLLQLLAVKGEQIIDLEGLAKHTGSAFNGFQTPQPSNEHFENLLAQQLETMREGDPIWVEDESKMIGKIYLHHQLYTNIQSARYVWVNRSLEERVTLLCDGYGSIEKDLLKQSFGRIEKRIGGQHMQAAHAFIDEGNFAAAAEIALRYYDKAYRHTLGIRERKPLLSLELSGKDNNESVQKLIAWKEQHLK